MGIYIVRVLPLFSSLTCGLGTGRSPGACGGSE
jgi:hypothetical protein